MRLGPWVEGLAAMSSDSSVPLKDKSENSGTQSLVEMLVLIVIYEVSRVYNRVVGIPLPRIWDHEKPNTDQ